MNILFVGDSWTYGDELQDNFTSRYSKIVCDELHSSEVNISNNGISNDDICERTTLYLNNNQNIDYVIVQFTHLRRISIPHDMNKTERRKYRTLTPGSFDKFDRSVMLHYLSKCNENPAWYDLSKYKVILLHNYLNSLNLKHLFLFIKNVDFADQILKDSSINPSIKEVCYSRGLYDICVEHNFRIGQNTHGLEEAHEYYARGIVIPRIKNARLV
jgi:hypothetical protein